MSLKCRLCGCLPNSVEFVSLSDLKIQEYIKKCGIQLEENELLPKNCCSSCVEVLENFIKFLAQIDKTQVELKENLQQTELQNRIKKEKEESSFNIRKRRHAKAHTKSPTKRKYDPEVPQESAFEESTFQIKLEADYELENPVVIKKLKLDNVRKEKRIKRKSQEKLKLTMEDIFEKELKQGIYDNPIEILNVAENEKNPDGSLNELGLLKFGQIKWSDYVWKCANCSYSTNVVSDLESHYKNTHKSSPIYKCDNCPKSCRKYSSCLNHIFEHKPFLKFCCDFCSSYFTNVLDFYHHRSSMHKDKRNFLCLYCCKHFDVGSTLKYHRSSHLPENSSKLFICDYCQKTFTVKHNLATHMQQNHIRTSQVNRDHICELCGVAFRQKGNLVAHQLIHTENRPFKCEICNESFKTFKRLRNHNLTHTKVKMHECDVCGKKFTLKSTLNVHYRIHSGVLPYECEFCGKKFRFNHCLKTHRRLHTGERPYNCSACNHSFTNWPNYNKHMKIRHGTDLSRRPKKIEMEQNYLMANNQNQNLFQSVVQSIIPNVVSYEMIENS